MQVAAVPETLNLLRRSGDVVGGVRPRRNRSDGLSDPSVAGGGASLFEFDRRVTDLSRAMDKANRLFGKHKVAQRGLRFEEAARCGSHSQTRVRPAFV